MYLKREKTSTTRKTGIGMIRIGKERKSLIEVGMIEIASTPRSPKSQSKMLKLKSKNCQKILRKLSRVKDRRRRSP